ncbi:MAG: dimethylargininase [Blastopirellula sp.]|nr:dimethylargininase [Blastopirellula sp.]
MTVISAILNRPTSALQRCQLTYLQRGAIDIDVAMHQHAQYAATLRQCGVNVELLECNQHFPDGVFVEDTAVVLDEVAVICSMGSASRRGESDAIGDSVTRWRSDVRWIKLPAQLEGGDVLRVGRTSFVGESPRTNRAGIAALAAIVEPCGYQVQRVRVHGCLHLKTGVTALDDDTFLCNRDWIDESAFANHRRIAVDPREPWSANVLRVGERLIVNEAHPRMADRLDAMGYDCQRVDISEFGKAEAGLTCLSLLLVTSS